MISRVSRASILQGFVKSRSFLAGNSAYTPPSFESIATATGTGSSGTITFSSIPSTFKHLQLRFIANDAIAAGIEIRFNNDSTTSKYVRHFLRGDGSTVTAGGTASGIFSSWYPNIYAGSTTNTMSVAIIDILDYASTSKNKTARSFWGYDNNGSGHIAISSGLYIDTTAINRIDIINGAPYNFTTSSTFALYGIKEA